MKQDTFFTKHSIARNIAIDVIPPACIAFLIFLTVPVNFLEQNLFWIGLAAGGIVILAGFHYQKKDREV